MDFFKYVAIAIGSSIIFIIIYPYIKGVRKGDRIFVENFIGIALDNGRIGDFIRAEINGEVVFCEVESYEGFLNFARARILAKKRE